MENNLLGLDPRISWKLNDGCFLDYPECRESHDFLSEFQRAIIEILRGRRCAVVVPRETWQVRCLLRVLYRLKITVEIRNEDLTSIVADAAEDSVIFLPNAEIRILNVHYNKQREATGGEPYFILWDTESTCRFWEEQKAHSQTVVVNWLKSSVRLMRSYFLTPEIQNWLTSREPGKHNYAVEERMFESIAGKMEESPLESLILGAWREHSPAQAIGQRVQSAPLDRFLENHFGIQMPINGLIRNSYRRVVSANETHHEIDGTNEAIEECDIREWREAVLRHAPETVDSGMIPDISNTHCSHQWYGVSSAEEMSIRCFRFLLEGEPVGWIFWYKTGPGVARARNMVIKPEYRRRGLGKEFYLASARKYCDTSVHGLLAFVTPQGMDFYRKLGFVEIVGIPSVGLWRGSNLKAMQRDSFQ